MRKKIKRKRSVPFFRQMEEAECGITTLAMLLSYYGHEISLYELREKVSAGRSGISLLTLKKLAIEYHFDSQGKRVSTEALNTIELPVICYWKPNHYVILEKVSGERFHIVDPAIGKLQLTKDEFKQSYSGVVLCCTPTNQFKRKKKDKSELISFLRPIFQEKKLLSLMIVFSFMLQGAALGIPILTQYLIDDVAQGMNIQLIHLIGLSMIGIVLFQIGFRYLHGYMLVLLAKKVDTKLIQGFISHLFSLPLRFFQIRSNGDLVMRSSIIEGIRELIVTHLLSTVINVMVLVVLFSYMLSQSIALTIGLVGIGLFQVIFTLLTRNKLKSITTKEVVAKANLRSYLTESIHGISLIKNLGAEEYFLKDWSQRFTKQIGHTYHKGKVELSINSVLDTVHLLVPAIILWVGTYQLVQGNITIGTLVAFQALAVSFLMPITGIANSITSLTQMDSLLELIMDVKQTPQENKEGLHVKRLRGSIKLENVSFQFDAYSKPVLKQINLTIPSNQKVAIIGESGSGKSTLAALISGLYEPTDGAIYFDHYDAKTLDKHQLSKQLGIVTQDHFLFSRTIYDNITLGNEDITYEEVIEATRKAEIMDDIAVMPLQYETLLSEQATNLSGGQKQRLALARAIVHNPKILILDEATSALDTVTEKRVAANLSQLPCTQIIIAHRLSTMKEADLIVIMKNGEIVGTGTHESLQDNHEYMRFYKPQEKKEEVVG
ncbi:peptidase domain-containing ABC transporter [Halalkalibacter alkalisediminis]|uniref:Peptidase domain-containing ABC transporter n=1 Tax=Halalkalibacter alkalisediminis TaxID=935616 RepID=A0ABV6NJ81_9BACI|nr:peptidase domain-containing ABC transporter [Halalkalibacter alkalisediminis]